MRKIAFFLSSPDQKHSILRMIMWDTPRLLLEIIRNSGQSFQYRYYKDQSHPSRKYEGHQVHRRSVGARDSFVLWSGQSSLQRKSWWVLSTTCCSWPSHRLEISKWLWNDEIKSKICMQMCPHISSLPHQGKK